MLLVFAGCSSPEDKKTDLVPLSDSARHDPQNAVKGLTVAGDLDLGLFAHEPMLTNPTNMDIA